MNILTFVSCFLLLLAIAFSTFMSQFFFDQKIKTSYDGYFAAHRKLREKSVQETYKKLPTKKEPKKPSSSSSVASEENRVLKKKEAFPECAKLNLWLLIQDDKTYYETFARLFRTLFEKNLLQDQPEKIEYKIIDEILSAAKNPQNNQVLNNLFLPKLKLKDAKLQFLLYKMLKGSKNYDFEKKTGYPSLLDFVKLSASSHSKTCLACSNKELLIALFGKDSALKIWALKNDDYDMLALKESELKEILQGSYSKKILSQLNFKHKRTKQVTITGEDLQKTGIRLRKKMTISS